MPREFEFVRLTDHGINQANTVGDLFAGLFHQLEQNIPNGRELSLVKTKLQEVCFWAKKAVSLNSENQKETNDE